MMREFNHFGRLNRQMRENTARIVAKTTHDIQRDVQENVHVITGALKGSYRASVEGTEGIVGTDKEYGPAEEYGTRYRPGHPHLTPAAEANRGGFIQAMREELFRR